jgi:hypothetical protein
MNLLEIGAGCAKKEWCAGLKPAGGVGLGFRVGLREPLASAVESGCPLPLVVCACVFR